MVLVRAGVAVSRDGLSWSRGSGEIEGARGQDKDRDVGRVMAPNAEDWWWLDTRHMTVSDVQVRHLQNHRAATTGLVCFCVAERRHCLKGAC